MGKSKGLELTSKYFGRTIRAFRLISGLSQDEVANRARISVGYFGSVERERGRLSEKRLCAICLALESKVGKPILKAVYDGVIVAMWEELRSVEVQMREEQGLAPAEVIGDYSLAEEEFLRNLDSYLEAKRRLASQVFRLGLRTDESPKAVDRALLESPGRRLKGRLRARKP